MSKKRLDATTPPSWKLPRWLVLELNGTPSTTNSGWLLPPMELMPRSMMDVEAPGLPLEGVIMAPATRPLRAFRKLSRWVSARSLPFTS